MQYYTDALDLAGNWEWLIKEVLFIERYYVLCIDKNLSVQLQDEGIKEDFGPG